ncbi:hypothetical protein BGX34_005664 [Mortierella sp. NVP85]|nr:hypothetical protein BGX34_005664 [Mortierella sp. NVP85]
MSDPNDNLLPGITIAKTLAQAPKQTMPSKDLLEIPEVMGIVASHLGVQDFTSCVCVSRSWRDAFLPHRWRAIRIKFKETHDSVKYSGPDNQALHKHRYLIQELTIQGPFGADKMHVYPSLRSLRIRFREKQSFDPRGVIDWDLTEKSPLLGYLLLAQVDVERLFCKTLSKHSNITSLDLEDVMIKMDVVSIFWEACRNLESLNMNNVFFEGEFVPVEYAWRGMDQLEDFGFDIPLPKVGVL